MSKRILFVTPYNNYTGSARVLQYVIQEQYKHEKKSLLTYGRDGLLSNIPDLKIYHLYYPRIKGRKLPIISGLVFKIDSWFMVLLLIMRYDVIYINTILPYYAAITAKIFRKQLIFHIHEKLAVAEGKFNIKEFVFNNISAKRIFVSKYVAEQYSHRNDCSSEIQYNRLSSDYVNGITPIPIDKRQLRTCIMISSISKFKGLDMFVDVANDMKDLNFFLVLSGSESEIGKFKATHLMTPNITIYSNVCDVRTVLNNADLMLNLTDPRLRCESFGMTILEAMPFGIPSIVPNAGGPVELIENGINGYCIDVTNKETIISTIRKVLSRAEYEKLSKGVLLMLNTKFS